MKIKDTCGVHREHWGTRLGLVLAMAGNAVGLGNFLRFPVQAAQNGGGAFMIPYFIALVLLAIPVMWCECAIGRLGGVKGHGTTPGMFTMLWKHPLAKYIGFLGIFMCSVVVMYYAYVESWTLAYSIFSVTGKYSNITSHTAMIGFLETFQGVKSKIGVSGLAYLFFLITFGINVWVVSGGIAKGIERLAKIAMPILFLFAIILVIRVFTLATPDPSMPQNNPINGLGFIWNVDFSELTKAKVWLAAAGQIFFTASIGMGSIHCYFSYLREKDDIAVTGLSSVMTNEAAEIILGGSIAIPIAFAFLGPNMTVNVANGGAYNLGFAALPFVFGQMPFGSLMGTFWFFLLFLAGITSSVAMMQPIITFFKDELCFSHKKAVGVMAMIFFAFGHIAIFGLKAGALDEMDFWGGTLGLPLFALVEVILFVWVFGSEKAWKQIMTGAQRKMPKIFLYVVKYITPLYLIILFVAWTVQSGVDAVLLKGIPPEHITWRWVTRIALMLLAGGLLYAISKSQRLKDILKK
jgi:NSS family neurotransmitter:Na+ symporter